MPRIEEWSIGSNFISLYQAPEAQNKYLHGRIYDDELDRFEDGSPIRTSSIQEFNLEESYAMTRNTMYMLGKPSVEYLEWLEEQGKKLEDYIF